MHWYSPPEIMAATDRRRGEACPCPGVGVGDLIDPAMFLVVLGEVFETCVGGRVVVHETATAHARKTSFSAWRGPAWRAR